jgi:hypothetical protein
MLGFETDPRREVARLFEGSSTVDTSATRTERGFPNGVRSVGHGVHRIGAPLLAPVDKSANEVANIPPQEDTMLFHVTLSHTEDNCPAYDRARMPEVLAAFENLSPLAEELKVKLQSFVWTPTDHVAYLLLEADNLNSLNRFIFSIPIKQHTKVVPVEPLSETVAMAKALMAQK